MDTERKREGKGGGEGGRLEGGSGGGVFLCTAFIMLPLPAPISSPSLPPSLHITKKKQICFIYFPIMTTTADFRLALCFTDLKHDKAAV